MSGVKWPHQMSPRHLGSIVDSQVQLWEMRQEHPVGPSSERAGPSVGPRALPEAVQKEDVLRHPWLHYWGDAIVAELTRLGQPHETGKAFLNDGMKETEEAEPQEPASRRRNHH